MLLFKLKYNLEKNNKNPIETVCGGGGVEQNTDLRSITECDQHCLSYIRIFGHT